MSPDVVRRAPNAGLVVEAYLGRILGSTELVGLNLPKEQSKWLARGFVTYTNLSGTPGLYLPVRNPVMRLDAWATTSTPGSGTPPWAKAYDLLEIIRDGVFGKIDQTPFEMTKPNYGRARMLSAYLTTEPAEVKGDPSGFARVQADLALEWVVAP